MAESIRAVKQKYSKWLRSLDDNISGVAVESSPDGDEYIAVYLRKMTQSTREVVPRELDGYPVHLVEVGEIYAR